MPIEARGHIPAALPDLSVKVMQDVKEYAVHRAVFPPLNVKKMSDQYFFYNVEDNFRVAQDYRANATESNGIDPVALTQQVYFMAEHSLHRYVSDRDRENADTAIDPEMDAVEEVTSVVARVKERSCALTIFTTTSFATANRLILSSNAWANDTTTSQIIDDIDVAKNQILLSTGKLPNGMVVGYQTWNNAVKDHADILDRIKWSERGVVSEDIAAMVLGLDSITIGKGINRTTEPGISATTGYIFNAAALIYYNDPSPKLRSSNFGVTFQKADPVIDKIRDDHRKSDKIEVSWTYDQRTILTNAGYLITAVN